MLHKWIVNELTEEGEKKKETLAQALKINKTLCGLLAQRGIGTYEEAEAFFCPKLEGIHDPFLMNDMDKAIERLDKALINKEKILVYGDYDVDGTTAVALVYKYLSHFTSLLDFYIPDRYNEGYGVSYKGIDYAAEGCFTLMIVLDCGIKAIEKVQYAKSKGVDVIICDHHTPDDTLPEAVAVLDPKRTDSTYPYGHLSGCGVGFKLMQAWAIHNRSSLDELMSYIDILAISIASDIVPITGENRILMHYGLKQLNSNPCIGVQAILDVCELRGKDINVSDIVFKIGPRINASGRMSSGREAVELLVSKDYTFARQKSACIDEYNRQRKDLDKETTIDAIEDIRNNADFSNQHSVVVYNPNWKKGVIGIVASRLSEQYFRPTVVMTASDNGLATGSARSIGNFDLYKAIDSCRDLLENFGGHLYAAGLTLKQSNIEEFKRRFDAYVRDNMSEDQRIPQIEVDAVLTFDEISARFIEILWRFAPFGPDNAKPVFITKGLIGTNGCRLVGHNQEHLKLELLEPGSNIIMSGIAFNQGKHYADLQAGKRISICYTLEENNFNGSTTIQLMVKDIKADE